MPKKMLIDATHAEETRVVVVDGNKVEEFDFESENKRQLAGNIYLAKVTRVEPSLQAAFVDYGGNRHGFLAFSEIHPDYYQIPVADREKLLKEEAEYAQSMAEEDARRDEAAAAKKKRGRTRKSTKTEAASDGAPSSDDKVVTSEVIDVDVIDIDNENDTGLVDVPEASLADAPVAAEPDAQPEVAEVSAVEAETIAPEAEEEAPAEEVSDTPTEAGEEIVEVPADEQPDEDQSDEPIAEARAEMRPRKPRPRRYKIQEVVKVRQILLVQVVKEERGNKGAALTTYLSLAGRYCVLMPNTARGGGISRKITNATDRKKLKDIASEIHVPEGAGLIIRTAGAKRTKTDIKRDYEYLLRQWEQIRELTLKSIAPAGIYEEGDLIKRSIRDLYNREIDEILVEGEAGYEIAREYMQMLLPTRVDRVKHYREATPLFARFQVENYLDGMFNPVVQLKSGGYIVIGITEALVAIDVNSGKSTKEGSIEDTAVRTNLEAAEEVARQLKLRDLAGLIVIDFIDMDERRNNSAVEKRMKDRLKNDRARLQVGRISSFGLMEMSRQRLRPGMLEATTQPCPSCHGTGLVRSDDSLSLAILRELEEEAGRSRSREVLITAPVSIANYLLNEKREHIALIESRFGMAIRVIGDPHLITPEYKLERFKTTTRRVTKAPQASPVTIDSVEQIAVESVEQIAVESKSEAPENRPENTDEQQPKKRRRRRRRRGGANRDRIENNDAATQDETPKVEGETSEVSAAVDASTDGPVVTAEAAAEIKAPQEAAKEENKEPAKKPRKSRTTTRSRSKKVETEPVVEEVVPAVEEVVEVDKSAEAEPPVAEKKPAKKPATRKPRAKKAPVAAKTEDGDTEAKTVKKPAARKKAPAKKATTRKSTKKAEPEAVAEVVETPAPVEVTLAPEPEPTPEPAPAAVQPEPEAPAEPAKPKRSGWWSRALGK
ncbi:MAG: ribonuclease E/G [Rhodobacteraceae bacterium]|nr:ribonuclease E/G [Paracoccaceae bacterium]